MSCVRLCGATLSFASLFIGSKNINLSAKIKLLIDRQLDRMSSKAIYPQDRLPAYASQSLGNKASCLRHANSLSVMVTPTGDEHSSPDSVQCKHIPFLLREFSQLPLFFTLLRTDKVPQTPLRASFRRSWQAIELFLQRGIVLCWFDQV